VGTCNTPPVTYLCSDHSCIILGVSVWPKCGSNCCAPEGAKPLNTWLLNLEVGEVLNIVSARVVWGGVGTVRTGVGAASPISVSALAWQKVMVAERRLLLVAGALNVAGTTLRDSDVTIAWCSSENTNHTLALMVKCSMYTLEESRCVRVRPVLNRLHELRHRYNESERKNHRLPITFYPITTFYSFHDNPPFISLETLPYTSSIYWVVCALFYPYKVELSVAEPSNTCLGPLLYPPLGDR